MNKTKLVSIAIILMFSLFVVGCSNNTTTKEEPAAEEEVDKTGPEYTSAYICPMHCEGSGSDAEGNCPECGMPYEPNKDFKAEEGMEGTTEAESDEEGGDDHEEHEH